MADQTKIEWADSTFNGWIGCTKVGPGCDHCYAENMMDTRMHRVNWGAGNPRDRTTEGNWRKPLQWNSVQFYECSSAYCGWRGEDPPAHRKACPRCGHYLNATRRRVFCSSLSDVFDNEVPKEWRVDLLKLIASTPNLDWMLLTKRIGNVAKMLDDAIGVLSHGLTRWSDAPWPNVWIGATIVNQEEADRDIKKLLKLPAEVRFLSMEPLLGPVDLKLQQDAPPAWTCAKHGLHWVIVGGESGPGSRPMNPEWVKSLRDQCLSAGVPFLFKQWGDWVGEDHPKWNCKPETLQSDEFVEIIKDKQGERIDYRGTYMARIGKHEAGREIDHYTYTQYPR